jgi:predicted CopG family antitoxin
MRNIRVDADVFEHLNAIARPDETAGEALQRMLAGHVIEVDDDTYAELVARSETFGESASEVIRRVLGLDEGPPPVNQPGLVTFHIAHGTGDGPWNTQATAIRVRVGDTLRIVNDDDVGHLLHTTGGGPFAHPSEVIAPGHSDEYVVTAPFDGRLYDHGFGAAAEVWITADPA